MKVTCPGPSQHSSASVLLHLRGLVRTVGRALTSGDAARAEKALGSPVDHAELKQRVESWDRHERMWH